MLKNSDILLVIVKHLPAVHNIDYIDSSQAGIYFGWEGYHFHVDAYLVVTVLRNGDIVREPIGFVVESLLRLAGHRYGPFPKA